MEHLFTRERKIGEKRKMGNITVNIRVSKDMRIILEEYRYTQGLYKKKLKLSNITGEIVSDWLREPTELLNEKSECRDDIIAISLSKDDKAKIHRLFGEKFIDSYRSINHFLYGILENFIENNNLVVKS